MKFVDLDFAPRDVPPSQLPFAAPLHYLPSRPSLLTRLAERSDVFSEQATSLVVEASTTLHRIDNVLDDIDGQHLPARVGQMLDRGGGAFADARRVLARVDRARLADHAQTALDRAGVAAASVDELARRTVDSSDELRHTLRDIGDAARGLRDFLDELERDPDMLVKGRARASGP